MNRYYQVKLLYFNNMSQVTREQQSELDSALFKKLEELTMKIPADPSLYKEDVLKYSVMYQEEFQKLLSDIQRKNQRFAELLIFLSRCVRHFTKELAYVPKQVIDLLKNHGPNLHPYVRKKCVGSIMILRAKNILYPVETIQFLFTLFNIEDKDLRTLLYKYILNDIRRMNKHHKNLKINQELKNFIYEIIVKNADKMTQKCLQMMIDLYKRNIWTDNRSVNIIAEGCFSQSPKIRMIASFFLISTTQPLEEMEDDSDDEKPINPADIKTMKGITKNTHKKEKKLEKEKKKALKKLNKREIQSRRENFMPIDVIYNPQDFAEKLFNFSSKKNNKFQHKLVYMSLISRLIWRHRLIILPWYGSLVKYLEPKQKDVHRVLTYFAQSVHENLPDEEIETVVKHIIEKFVNDRCSEFAMTVGLNTIREVYHKMNSIITEDNMLYLSTYYDYKNKNVRMAAKSLINLVRDINPYLLQKKYRGRGAGGQSQPKPRSLTKDRIDGAQLLTHKGDLPVYLDRILSDEDFKNIRKLKRKQEEEEEWEEINDQQLDQLVDGEEEEEGEEEGEEGEGEDDEGEIDWDDMEEVQEYDQQDGDEDEEEGDEEEEDQEGDEDEEIEIEDGDEDIQIQDDEDGEEDDEEEDDEDDSQIQIQGEQMEDESEQKKVNKKSQKKNPKKSSKGNDFLQDFEILQEYPQQAEQKSSNKKDKKKKKDNFSSDSDYESQSDPNPHGFLHPDVIGHYKQSKTEIKAERKRKGVQKPKFKHAPKEKKGGSTNREKQKLKPLLMLRAKKNRIRSQEKQVKLRIKNLKNQLGKVRSGKEAKKMKNKKIVKKTK